jgi:putative DNA primase/helicase
LERQRAKERKKHNVPILEHDLPCKILEAALSYAVHWTVFPTKPDKRGSYKSAARSGGRAWGATSDPDEICRDFVRWPDAGIGIPTGAGNGIVVVEYDTVVGHGVDGAAALEELQDRHGRLPDTLQALTASGSLHNYLKHPGAGIKIKCSNSELGPGIDVKGDGGMVIAPPSNGRRWLNRNPIAVMPDWLVELTREPPPKRLSIRERATAAVNAHRLARMFQSGGAGAYAAAALADEIDSLSRAPATTRNTALNKSAFSLGQLVYAGLLQQAEVERHLVDACSANGLTADDGLPSVIATIRSAFHGAAAKPRRGLA